MVDPAQHEHDPKGQALVIALASLYETAYAGCVVDRTLARKAIADINVVLFGGQPTVEVADAEHA